jgi:phenylpropionate dioxygenase-like ring-hydroxylating dioxygenase large terminal subunit
MNDPAWATVTHTMLFERRHDLIHDNLLDLTHESFLHKTTVGDDYIYEHAITVEVHNHVVTVDRLMPDVEASPLYAQLLAAEAAATPPRPSGCCRTSRRQRAGGRSQGCDRRHSRWLLERPPGSRLHSPAAMLSVRI